MNEKESKATKYDWADVPTEVVAIATDMDGWAYPYTSVPTIDTNEIEWIGLVADTNECQGYLAPSCNPFSGDWRDSLEQRPHPCTPCPNFTNDTCLHSTAQNDFEAMDAKHCSPLCKQSGATIPNFVCAVLILLGLIICMALNAQVGAA